MSDDEGYLSHLKKSFFVGYNELWDDDFFVIKGEKLDTLSLIDRINLYFKGNPNIPFADEEKVWLNAPVRL